MNLPQIFKHVEFGSLRIIDRNGDPWFVANDVAKALGYEKPNNAVNIHCRKVNKFNYPETGHPLNIIPESDVYRLIMRSNLPSAEQFQDWVCEDVLPTIRESGKYSFKKAIQRKEPSRTKIAADLKANIRIAQIFGFEGNQALLTGNRMTARQYKDFDVNPLLECGAVLEVEDKVQYFTPTQLGKELNMSPVKINQLLADAGLQKEVRDQKNRKSWEVMEEGKPFCQIVDTDKKKGSGAPVVQIKWSMDVLNYARPQENAQAV